MEVCTGCFAGSYNIINELISNSVKHAFPMSFGIGSENWKSSGSESKECIIKIKFYMDNGRYILLISDDGRGLPDDLKIENVSSMGLTIVKSLVDQMRSEISIDRTHGTEFTIKFP